MFRSVCILLGLFIQGMPLRHVFGTTLPQGSFESVDEGKALTGRKKADTKGAPSPGPPKGLSCGEIPFERVGLQMRFMRRPDGGLYGSYTVPQGTCKGKASNCKKDLYVVSLRPQDSSWKPHQKWVEAGHSPLMVVGPSLIIVRKDSCQKVVEVFGTSGTDDNTASDKTLGPGFKVQGQLEPLLSLEPIFYDVEKKSIVSLDGSTLQKRKVGQVSRGFPIFFDRRQNLIVTAEDGGGALILVETRGGQKIKEVPFAKGSTFGVFKKSLVSIEKSKDTLLLKDLVGVNGEGSKGVPSTRSIRVPPLDLLEILSGEDSKSFMVLGKSKGQDFYGLYREGQQGPVKSFVYEEGTRVLIGFDGKSYPDSKDGYAFFRDPKDDKITSLSLSTGLWKTLQKK